MAEEWFPRVNEVGEVIGRIARSEAHGHPELIHPVVHCLVETPDGRLLLQLRGRKKDIDPLRWDTSVGGHVAYGESIDDAVLREIQEEIGIAVDPARVSFLYRWLRRSQVETELVHSYRLIHPGPFRPNHAEIERLALFDEAAIASILHSGRLTASFELE